MQTCKPGISDAFSMRRGGGRWCQTFKLLDRCCYHSVGSSLFGIHTFLWDNAEVSQIWLCRYLPEELSAFLLVSLPAQTKAEVKVSAFEQLRGAPINIQTSGAMWRLGGTPGSWFKLRIWIWTIMFKDRFCTFLLGFKSSMKASWEISVHIKCWSSLCFTSISIPTGLLTWAMMYKAGHLLL